MDRKDKELFVEKADNMRKSKIVLLCLLCLTITACSNEFAKREYDSAEKLLRVQTIIQKQDLLPIT